MGALPPNPRFFFKKKRSKKLYMCIVWISLCFNNIFFTGFCTAKMQKISGLYMLFKKSTQPTAAATE